MQTGCILSQQHASDRRTKVPPASSPAAQARMRHQRRSNTGPERALRSLLHRAGLRYLVDAPLPLQGVRRRADLLFRGGKVAVFVDGCYWHACPVHGTSPKANAEWWARKLAANVARDRDTDRRLEEAGWLAVRLWEHEQAGEAAARVYQIVATRSSCGTVATAGHQEHDRAEVVESAWGAVPGLPSVRFPRPLAEPAVPVSWQRALHGLCLRRG